MVVYDVSKRESFTSCAKWLKAVRDLRPNRPIQGVLVANKVDLKESGRAVVDSAEGMAFAKEMDLAFFETSAVRWRYVRCCPYYGVSHIVVSVCLCVSS